MGEACWCLETECVCIEKSSHVGTVDCVAPAELDFDDEMNAKIYRFDETGSEMQVQTQEVVVARRRASCMNKRALSSKRSVIPQSRSSRSSTKASFRA